MQWSLLTQILEQNSVQPGHLMSRWAPAPARRRNPTALFWWHSLEPPVPPFPAEPAFSSQKNEKLNLRQINHLPLPRRSRPPICLLPSNREIHRPKQSLRQCQIVPPTIMTDQISTTRIASDQLSGAQQRAIGALLTTRTINEAALAALRFLAKAQSTAKFAKKAKSFACFAVLCAFARNAEPSTRRVRIRPVRELPSE